MTAMVICLTHLQAVLLTSNSLKATIPWSSSTSSLPPQQQTKVVFCQSTFTSLRTTPHWPNVRSSTWHSHCVTSISTGQAPSKFRLLASTRTRLLSSSRTLGKGLKPGIQHSKSKLSRKLRLWTPSSTSYEERSDKEWSCNRAMYPETTDPLSAN
jgi:hypothetical protein